MTQRAKNWIDYCDSDEEQLPLSKKNTPRKTNPQRKSPAGSPIRDLVLEEKPEKFIKHVDPLIAEIERTEKIPIFLNVYNVPEGVNEADILNLDDYIKEVAVLNQGKTDIMFETKNDAIRFLDSGPKIIKGKEISIRLSNKNNDGKREPPRSVNNWKKNDYNLGYQQRRNDERDPYYKNNESYRYNQKKNYQDPKDRNYYDQRNKNGTRIYYEKKESYQVEPERKYEEAKAPPSREYQRQQKEFPKKERSIERKSEIKSIAQTQKIDEVKLATQSPKIEDKKLEKKIENSKQPQQKENLVKIEENEALPAHQKKKLNPFGEAKPRDEKLFVSEEGRLLHKNNLSAIQQILSPTLPPEQEMEAHPKQAEKAVLKDDVVSKQVESKTDNLKFAEETKKAEKSLPEPNIQTQKPEKIKEIEKIKAEIKSPIQQEIPLNSDQKEISQKIIAGKEDELKITKMVETPQEKNEKDQKEMIAKEKLLKENEKTSEVKSEKIDEKNRTSDYSDRKESYYRRKPDYRNNERKDYYQKSDKTYKKNYNNRKYEDYREYEENYHRSNRDQNYQKFSYQQNIRVFIQKEQGEELQGDQGEQKKQEKFENLESIIEKSEKVEQMHIKPEIIKEEPKQTISTHDKVDEKTTEKHEKSNEIHEKIIENPQKPLENVDKKLEEPQKEAEQKPEAKNNDLKENQINKEKEHKYEGNNRNSKDEQRIYEYSKKEKNFETNDRSKNFDRKQDKQEIIQERYESERQPKQRGYENKGKNYYKYDDRSRYNQSYKSNRPQTHYEYVEKFVEKKPVGIKNENPINREVGKKKRPSANTNNIFEILDD